MRKIPTLFVRDPENRRRVLPIVTEGCEWVMNGEGVATRKFDGSCCLVREGKLWRRHEVKPGRQPPKDFDQVDFDSVTGKTVGWVPVGDDPGDRWHREAIADGIPEDGTYELCGPKVQGNPEDFDRHVLIPHGSVPVKILKLSYDNLRELLLSSPYEGVVWWRERGNPDAAMAKLKRRDFS